MTDESRVIRHVIVRGHVQGVGFRAFVEHYAIQCSLEGWVRNRRDGSVEAVFAGPLRSVEAMISACGVGPFGSHIDALDQREGAGDDMVLGRPGVAFSMLPTE